MPPKRKPSNYKASSLQLRTTGRTGRTGKTHSLQRRTTSETGIKACSSSRVLRSHRNGVYLRVANSFLRPLHPPSTNRPTHLLPNDPLASGHLYLISGSLTDVVRYSGPTVDWLLKIAHLICEPLGLGQLYTHNTGTVDEWYDQDRSGWVMVTPGDMLREKIYEFQPSGPVSLTQISMRQQRSRTSKADASSSSTFKNQLQIRDVSCVVTRFGLGAIASHLIPKRMGAAGTSAVVSRFAGASAAAGVHDFHPMVGIMLSRQLNFLMEAYSVGFYHVKGNTYVVHNFCPDYPDLNISGIQGLPGDHTAALHGYEVTLVKHGGSCRVPPAGVFNWHYVQCVIKRFRTNDYQNFANILHYEIPLKTEDDDSGEEYGDDEIDPPYPTYRFDTYMSRQGEYQRLAERNCAVAAWTEDVVP